MAKPCKVVASAAYQTLTRAAASASAVEELHSQPHT